MTQKEKPEIIDLPAERFDKIKIQLIENSLLDEDKKIILSILTAYAWLYRQLQSKKLSMRRLKNFFGFSTEKRSYLKKTKDVDDTPPGVDGSPDKASEDTLGQGGNVVIIKKFLNGASQKTTDV